MSSIDPTPVSPTRFRVAFSGGAPPGADTAVQIRAPWLAGATAEELFGAVEPLAATEPGLRLFRAGQLILGHAWERFVPDAVAARSESLYRRILAATRGRHLYRIWNYVPEINAHTAGLEHYRAFCQGRSFAFEATLGGAFEPRLPAASAVGCTGTQIDAIFVAGSTAPTHFENPAQVPAYHYPPEHGPRAPSFARATVAHDGSRRWTFISGTAAIKGHETVAPGRLEEQLACTRDNLRLISQAAGLGEDLGAGGTTRRHFKVYLRHAADLAPARAHLEATLFQPADEVTYLQCDICRATLNVEIEATLAH